MKPVAFALVVLALVACGEKAPPADAVDVVLSVEGMTCEGCVAHVKTDLAAFEGVYAVEVDLDTGTATCKVDKTVDPIALSKAVTGDYKVAPKP